MELQKEEKRGRMDTGVVTRGRLVVVVEYRRNFRWCCGFSHWREVFD
jgi:hypothetical protein